MTRQEITDLVKKDERYTVAALLAINNFQTEDEQMVEGTIYQNGRGFNGADAPFFTDLVRYYRERGYLTPNMINSIRRHLPKYFGQLDGVDLEPAPFKTYNQQSPSPSPSAEETEPQKNNKTVKLNDGWLEIVFPYDPGTVAKVKTLSDREWDSKNKVWYASVCFDSVEKLKQWGFDIEQPVLDMVATVKPDQKKLASFDKNFKVPGLKMELFPYQKEGVQFIEARNGRALIGDEMGLGKTCQALAWLQLHPELRPAVIIVPASLKLNWEREISMWMTKKCKTNIISGRAEGSDPLPKADIYIINYDILPNKYITAHGEFCWIHTKELCKGERKRWEYVPFTGWVDYLKGMKVMVTDECHYYKNNDAARTDAIKALGKAIPYTIALSGTPIVNRPMEFFNAISIIEPKLFPSFFKFAQRYCGATHNGFGWDFTGATNMGELHEVLTETIMIRRVKADVLKDLPPKRRTVVPMEITNRREYRQAERNFIEWVGTRFGKEKAEKAAVAEALVKIGELKRLAVKGKLDACIEWVRDFIESGEKLVIFAVHQFVIERLMEEFKDMAVKVDGSVAMSDRQKAVDQFQTLENVRLFIGNIKAAGVGLTLTKASNTCFLELEWTPGVHDQAEDRVHRIGQTSDSVTAWYLLADATMEEEIATLIDEKRKVLAQVLDGKDVDKSSMLSELLKKYQA